MHIIFPADGKLKARLDAVCKSLNMTYDQWFEAALRESEFQMSAKFLGNPKENKNNWIWDTELRRFVRQRSPEQ